ncbi:MAG: Ig-like domain-containing protein [Velocimicrobium sp.]
MGKQKKTGRKIITIILMLGLLLSNKTVKADSSPKLNTKSTKILVGKSYKLKVNNIKTSSKVTWSSNNNKIATVSKRGNVKGISKGTVTIHCCINSKITLKAKILVIEKAKKISLTRAYYDMNIGERKVVKTSVSPKTSNDIVTYTSSDKNIASINAKTGEIVAKKTGSTTITAKTVTGKKVSYKVTIYDKDTKIVRTQKRLDKAIKENSHNQIVLSSYQNQLYNIPKGEFPNTELIINIPNGDVKNYGLFKSITIKGIKDNTYYECVDGNTILVVDDKSSIQVLGKPAEVQVLSGGVANINIVGKKANFKIIVKNGTEVITTGKDTNSVAVEIMDTGSKVISSIPINITINEKAGKPELVFIKGAENSTIKAEKEEQLGNIENRTDKEVKISVGKNEEGSNTGGGTAGGGSAVITPGVSRAKVTVGSQMNEINAYSILDAARYEVTFTNMNLDLDNNLWKVEAYDGSGKIKKDNNLNPFTSNTDVSCVKENGKYYIYLSSNRCDSGTYYLRFTDRNVLSNVFVLKVGEETDKTEITIDNSDLISLSAGGNGRKEYTVNSLHLSGGSVEINWCDANGNNISTPVGLEISYTRLQNYIISKANDTEAGNLSIIENGNSKAGVYYFKASVNGVSSKVMPLVVNDNASSAKVTVGSQMNEINAYSISDAAKYEVTFTNMNLDNNLWKLEVYDESGKIKMDNNLNPFTSNTDVSCVKENGKYYIYLSSNRCNSGTYYLRFTNWHVLSNVFVLKVGEETDKTEITIDNNDLISLSAGDKGRKEYTVNSLHLSGGSVEINWCDVNGNNISTPAGLKISYTKLQNYIISEANDTEAGSLSIIENGNSKAGVYYFKASVNGVSSKIMSVVVDDNASRAKVTVGSQMNEINAYSILDAAKYEVTFTNMDLDLDNNRWELEVYDEAGKIKKDNNLNSSTSNIYVSCVKENGKYYIYLRGDSCNSGIYYLRLTNRNVLSNVFVLKVGEETDKTEIAISNNDWISLSVGDKGRKEYTVNSMHLSGGSVEINWCDAKGNIMSTPEGLEISYTKFQLQNHIVSKTNDTELGSLIIIENGNSKAGVYYFKASVNGVSSKVIRLVVNDNASRAKVTVGSQMNEINAYSILDAAKYEVTFTNMNLDNNWWRLEECDESGKIKKDNYFNPLTLCSNISFIKENDKYYIYISSSKYNTGTYYFRLTDWNVLSNIFVLKVGKETDKTEITIDNNDWISLSAGDNGRKEYTVNSLYLSSGSVEINWCDVNGNNISTPRGLEISYTKLQNHIISKTKGTEVGSLVITENGNSKAGVYYFKASVNGVSSKVMPLVIKLRIIDMG